MSQPSQPTFRAQVTSGIAWSGGGRVAQQVIQFGLSVVLARLLTPGDYGLMAMVLVFTGFFGMLSDAGFVSALVQKKDVTETHISTVFWLNVVTGLLLAGITVGIAPVVAGFFHNPILTPILRVIAVNFILSCLASVPYGLLQKRLQFAVLAQIDTAALVLSGIFGVVLAYQGAGVWSLVLQSIACQGFMLAGRWWACHWRPRLVYRFAALKEMWGYAGHLYAFTFVSYWVGNADNLMVGKFFGAAALGIYSRAYGLMLLPINQFQSLGYQVMLPALSSIQEDKERVQRIFLRAVGIIALLSFPLLLGLMAVARPFILTVYGEKWAGVIAIVQILPLVGMMQLIMNTLGPVLLSQGRAKVLAYWWTLFYLLIIAAFGVGVLLGSVRALALCYVAGTAVCFYPALVIGGRAINVKASQILAALVGPLICAGLMAGGVAGLQLLLPETWHAWQSLLLLVGTGGVLYLILIVLFKLTAWGEFTRLLREKFGSRLGWKA